MAKKAARLYIFHSYCGDLSFKQVTGWALANVGIESGKMAKII